MPAAPARSRRLVWAGVAIWSLLMLWLSLASGIQHDYISYIQQWKLVLSDINPWSWPTDNRYGPNAYGPLHNVFAYLLSISDLAPKILFSITLIAANGMLVHEIIRDTGIGWGLGIYVLAVPANFLIISMAFTYGANDGLVAAFIIFAVVARTRGCLVLAGCILGLAVLLKYYPAFLVPMFALDRGRFRLRVVLGAGIVVTLGLAATMLIWGDEFLAALSLGIVRYPNLLSILSSLTSYPSLGEYVRVHSLIRYNAIIVLMAGAAGIFIAWKLHLHWLEGSVVGLLTILLIYKMGNQEYYVPWLFLVSSLPLSSQRSGQRLSLICLPFVVFLSAFQWGYSYDHYTEKLAVIRSIAGFLAFPLGVATVATYLWSLRRSAGHSSALAAEF